MLTVDLTTCPREPIYPSKELIIPSKEELDGLTSKDAKGYPDTLISCGYQLT